MNNLEKYQDIFDKFFERNKLQAFLQDSVLLDDCIKFKKETNISIPIKKIECLFDLKNYRTNREEVKKEVLQFVNEQDFSEEEFFYVYIYTVDNWINNHSLSEVIQLIDVFSNIMEHVLFAQYITAFNYFYELGIITLFERIDEFSKDISDDFQNTLYYIQICAVVFYIDATSNQFDYKKETFLNYVNLIGIKKYKKFLDEFYKYIIILFTSFNKFSTSEKKYLYNIFINQCKYSELLSANKIEKCLLLFAKNGIYGEKGLKLLQKINSLYVEEYKSYLLMKELEDE